MEAASRPGFDPPCRLELAVAQYFICAMQFLRRLLRGGRAGDRPAQALVAVSRMRDHHLAKPLNAPACVEGTRGVGDDRTAWAKGRRTGRGLVSCADVPRLLPPKHDGWLGSSASDDVGGWHGRLLGLENAQKLSSWGDNMAFGKSQYVCFLSFAAGCRQCADNSKV